ncbi:MAG: transglycosylase domain-containing protein [Gemmatimonadales bacterium]
MPAAGRLVRRLLLAGRIAAAGLAAGLLVIGIEALTRGRLTSPLNRVPSALYTRPVPWGTDTTPASVLGSLDRGPLEARVPVGMADVPRHLVDAVLAIEDRRFFQHHGIDIRRIGGALLANFKAGTITQGASTLTQQLSKNLFLTARRTPLRKLREIALALVLEARYDKSTILDAYLHEIYLGQDGARSMHGIGAAARYYFGKDVRRVTVAEAALLAGMISAPNRYAPTRNPELARKRRDLVLEVMAEQGRITRNTADRARRSALPTRAYPAVAIDGRWFRDFALGALPAGLPARGAAVYSTLDTRLQVAAERAVRNGLRRLRGGELEAALVALDPRTGEVLAMVGGRNYAASQFNRAAFALRQPGSAFKPIVALAALERGDDEQPLYTLASTVEDEPLVVRTSNGSWEPTNYDGQYRGQVTLRRALEQSLNIPFARIGLTVGPGRIVSTARRLGITSPVRAVPSVALGSSEVTLLELTRAYGVFAAGGTLAPTHALYGQARYGEPIVPWQQPDPVQAADPAAAYLVTSALEGVVTRGTGWALKASRWFPGVAGKTGTSNEWRDAWFVAYSPAIVIGAWVGYDDGQSLGMTGSMAALPMVAELLAAAYPREAWGEFEVPEGIVGVNVRTSGDWLPWDCGDREVFLRGTEPPAARCLRFEWPWDGDSASKWSERLEARASRIVEQWLGRALDRLRSRR